MNDKRYITLCVSVTTMACATIGAIYKMVIKAME